MSLEEPEEANAEGLKFTVEIQYWNLVFLFHFYIKKSVKRNIIHHTSSISAKNFKKFLFQPIEFKTNFF